MEHSNSESQKAILDELKNNTAKAQSRVDEFRLIVNFIEQNANACNRIVNEAAKLSQQVANYKQLTGLFSQNAGGSQDDAVMDAIVSNSCKLVKQMTGFVNQLDDLGTHRGLIKHTEAEILTELDKARSLLTQAEAALKPLQSELNAALAASMED